MIKQSYTFETDRNFMDKLLKQSGEENPQGVIVNALVYYQKILEANKEKESAKNEASLNGSVSNALIYAVKISEAKSEIEKRKIEIALSGVLCDIFGTLFTGKKPDYKLIERNYRKLLRYDESGKVITLVTDGDPAIWQKVINRLPFAWPVRRKSDFFGKKAEVVIDDMSEIELKRIFNITAKTFIPA